LAPIRDGVEALAQRVADAENTALDARREAAEARTEAGDAMKKAKRNEGRVDVIEQKVK
jgi:hypothetical protein